MLQRRSEQEVLGGGKAVMQGLSEQASSQQANHCRRCSSLTAFMLACKYG